METKLTKKDQILQSAIEIFCDNGFDRTTISEVAKHAGIGKGTVYEYFKSKEQLFISCVQSMLDYYNAGFMQILNKDISFRDKLLEQFKHADELFSRAAIGISLMHKQPTEDMLFLHDIFEKERIFLKEMVDNAVKIAIENNEIRNDLSIDTLTFYIQMSTFRIMQANAEGSSDENMIDDILTLIYSGIGTN